MLPDEMLLVRLRAGDSAAFDALYERYERKLFGFCLRYVGNREAAEEIFHDAWLAVLAERETVILPGRFPAWLFRVARNLCLNRLRARRRSGEAFLAVETPAPDPADEASRRAVVASAASELPPRLADVYRLRADGMSYEEVAEALGIPVGTVRSRLHETVTALKRKVKSWDAT